MTIPVEEEDRWYVKMYKTFIGRFFDGDGGIPNSERAMSHFFNLMFPFTVHPGPLNSAIEAAHQAEKSVCIMVYSQYNQNTDHVLNILKNEQVATLIKDNYIFYPILATTKEGLEVATHFDFSALPLIVVLRPNGSTINDSRIFVTHEGMISTDVILSYFQVERTVTNNEEGAIENQEGDQHEHEEGHNEENENLLGESVQTSNTPDTLKESENANDMINLEEYKEDDAIHIRFIFSDKDALEFRFSPTFECKLVHDFVRSIVNYNFELTTGIDKQSIPNDGSPLKDVVVGNHVVIYCSTI